MLITEGNGSSYRASLQQIMQNSIYGNVSSVMDATRNKCDIQ